mmetsp:Transcript_133522/g.337159  ORF Transcript_133522/g.337159 Transcript_133522/m.337159 type:complete len:224 (+) Transcript_133522:160-831(+)
MKINTRSLAISLECVSNIVRITANTLPKAWRTHALLELWGASVGLSSSTCKKVHRTRKATPTGSWSSDIPPRASSVRVEAAKEEPLFKSLAKPVLLLPPLPLASAKRETSPAAGTDANAPTGFSLGRPLEGSEVRASKTSATSQAKTTTCRGSKWTRASAATPGPMPGTRTLAPLAQAGLRSAPELRARRAGREEVTASSRSWPSRPKVSTTTSTSPVTPKPI